MSYSLSPGIYKIVYSMDYMDFIVYCALDNFCEFFEIWNKLSFNIDILQPIGQ